MDKPEITIDDLAQEIRRVDGNHDLGAGALAEALKPFIETALSERNAWRGIETAPISNGSHIFLAYVPGHGCSVCHALQAISGRLICSNATGRVITRATHWQPLPAPPSVQGEE